MTLLAGLAALCVLLTLPGTGELLLVTFGALRGPDRRRGSVRPRAVRLCAIVTAPETPCALVRCLESLRASDAELPIVVLTGTRARGVEPLARLAGARVIVRAGAPRGIHAVAAALETLAAEGFDAYLVVDADSVVDPDFVPRARAAFEDGADAVQARRIVQPTSLGARIAELAGRSMHVACPRGRERIRKSCGLLTDGFGIGAHTLAHVPCDDAALADELDYHVRLVRAGRKVRFLERTAVCVAWRPGPRARDPRRRGRAHVAGLAVPRLLHQVLLGRLDLVMPLLDLLLLPLRLHALLLTIALALGSGPVRAVAAASLGLLAVHVAVALWLGRGAGASSPGRAARAPVGDLVPARTPESAP